MNRAIRVLGVTKTFAEGAAVVRALNGISFHVDNGELVLLMGPSGSGKTTLLSIMGCILRPTAGSVAIRGREVTGLDERELPQVRLAHIGPDGRIKLDPFFNVSFMDFPSGPARAHDMLLY